MTRTLTPSGDRFRSTDLTAPWRHVDTVLLGVVVLVVVTGTAMVYSATRNLAGGSGYMVRQGLFVVLGAALMVGISLIDYRRIADWWQVIYGLSLIGMAGIFTPLGAVVNGTKGWYRFGPFSLQPAEFAKLGVILAVAAYLSQSDRVDLRRLAVALGLFGVPTVMTLLQPDLGSALVFLPTGLAILFVAGIPRRYLLRLLGGAGLLGALFVGNVLFAPPNWQIKLEDYQRRRLLVYFGREEAPPPGASRAELARLRQQQADYSHNVRQALISVGSGGLTGKGWRQGTQNALGFLPRPVAHNDFIFSVIAEEKGFVGSVIVITLYGAVLFSGIRIAGQARDRLGKMMAVGVVALIFSHVFINIGMNIRLMPVTGVPLPLLSYGGSSVLGSLIAMGILQNVYFYRRTY